MLQCVFDIINIIWCFVSRPAEEAIYLTAAETECLQQLFVKSKRSNIFSSVCDIHALFNINVILIKLCLHYFL